MWHRLGATVFISCSLTILLGVCAGLLWLSGNVVTGGSSISLEYLVAASLTIMLATIALFTFQVSVHLLAAARARISRRQELRCQERWLSHLVEGLPLPKRSTASAAALANLRELLDGEEGERLAAIYRQQGYLARDHRLLFGRRAAARVKALERLAQIRHVASIEPLRNLITIAPHGVAVAALHTLARVLSSETASSQTTTLEFTAALDSRSFTPGEIQSALVLMGQPATAVVEHMLRSSTHVQPALSALWRSNIVQNADLLLPYLGSGTDDEQRAEALRAVAHLEYCPDGAVEQILAALSAEKDFVRAQAAKALIAIDFSLAQDGLLRALGDGNYWVRKNAADTLFAFGDSGRHALSRATTDHPDAFARDAARFALHA